MLGVGIVLTYNGLSPKREQIFLGVGLYHLCKKGVSFLSTIIFNP